jgi:hypothetical protein
VTFTHCLSTQKCAEWEERCESMRLAFDRLINYYYALTAVIYFTFPVSGDGSRVLQKKIKQAKASRSFARVSRCFLCPGGFNSSANKAIEIGPDV